jgi:hypothetical protein
MGLLLKEGYDRFNLLDCRYDEDHENDTSLEEKACYDLLNTARRISQKYHNYARWQLNAEDLFGEMMIEVTKSFFCYLRCKPYDQYLRLSRSMMHNRAREIIKRTYGSSKNKEYTAETLPEDYTADSYVDHEIFYFLPEFMSALSEFARYVVNLILEPNDAMYAALMEHVNYRQTKYSKGAGVKRIPAKVIAKAAGASVSKVNSAYKEITKAYTEFQDMLNSNDVYTHKYAEEEVLQHKVIIKGKPFRYVMWRNDHLQQQVDFRFGKGSSEGKTRADLVMMLIQYDEEKHGLKSEDLDEVPSKAVQDIHEDTKSVSPKPSVATSEVGPDGKPYISAIERWRANQRQIAEEQERKESSEEEPEEQEMLVTKVEEVKNTLEKHLSERGHKLEQEAAEQEKSIVSSEPVAVQPMESVTEAYPVANMDVIEGLMQAMREGEVLMITKVSQTAWSAALVPADRPVLTLAQPATVKTETSGKKFKRDSQAYFEEIYTPEYFKMRNYFRAMSLEEVTDKLDRESVTYKTHNDKRTQRIYCMEAYAEHLKLDKFKPQYQTTEQRDAVTA